MAVTSGRRPATLAAVDRESGESRALLALMLTPGLGQTLVRRCVEAFGSAEATLGVTSSALGGIRGIAPARAGALKRAIDESIQSGRVDDELQAIDAGGATLLSFDEPAYPRLLKLVPDPPLLLWVRGTPCDDDALALGIVGSRKCSHYGREQADRFAGGCASAGLCIVSGGAYGIDAAAHRAALRAGGRTTAVLGSGLARPYPKEHATLFDQIVDSGGGAVISEFAMTTGPRAEHFPRRNRIISGLSLGVLVIEAARRSGALITARRCVDDHGRECMALPGRVDSPASAGCLQAIREGWASLVTSPTDVMDQLGEAGQLLKAQLPDEATGAEGEAPLFDASLTDVQRSVMGLLDRPKTFDEIAASLNEPAGRLQAELTMLEIRGSVQRSGGRFVARRRGG